MTTYDAIIPAGGSIDTEFADKVGTHCKALIRLGELTILERTIEALKSTGLIGRIVVVGNDEVNGSDAAKQASLTARSGNSGPESILNGLKALLAENNPPEKVLIVTSDLPFLTPSLIGEFIQNCPTDVDLCLPLITKTRYQARFPHSTATFIPLQDDTWTAGNIYLIDVKALQKSMPHMERIFAVRKSKIGMAKLLGPVFLFRFLRKTLTVPMIEAKLKQILGCTGAPIFDCAPELAYDVDDLEDYDYAVSFLAGERTHD